MVTYDPSINVIRVRNNEVGYLENFESSLRFLHSTLHCGQQHDEVFSHRSCGYKTLYSFMGYSMNQSSCVDFTEGFVSRRGK